MELALGYSQCSAIFLFVLSGAIVPGYVLAGILLHYQPLGLVSMANATAGRGKYKQTT
jgi:hypothetical protein